MIVQGLVEPLDGMILVITAIHADDILSSMSATVRPVIAGRSEGL